MIFRNSQRYFITLSLITALSSISLEVNADGKKDKTVLLTGSPSVGKNPPETALQPMRVRGVGHGDRSFVMEMHLSPHGAKERTFYRDVVADVPFLHEGRFIEKVGSKAPFEDRYQFRIDLKGDKKIEVTENETGGTILWDPARGEMQGNSLLIAGKVLREIPTNNFQNLKMVVELTPDFRGFLTHQGYSFIVKNDGRIRVSAEGLDCYVLLARLQRDETIRGRSEVQVSVTVPDEETRRRVEETFLKPELKIELAKAKFFQEALGGKNADAIFGFFNKNEGPSSGIIHFENEKGPYSNIDDSVFFDEAKRIIYAKNLKKIEDLYSASGMDGTVPAVVLINKDIDFEQFPELARNLFMITPSGTTVLTLPKKIEEREPFLRPLEAQNVPVIYGMAVQNLLQLETVNTPATIGPDPFLKFLLSPPGVSQIK